MAEGSLSALSLNRCICIVVEWLALYENERMETPYLIYFGGL